MIDHRRTDRPRRLSRQALWRPFAVVATTVMALAAIVTAAAQEVPAVEAELVLDGLVSPVLLTAPSGDDRRFIVEQTGEVRILDPEGQLLETPFLDLSDHIVELADGFEERGLLGLAFHPDYAANGRLYVHYSAPLRDGAPGGWDHTARIAQFRVSDDDPNTVDPGSERILLHVDHPNPKTNGGALAFGPHDGLLYAAIGEGGGAHGIGEVVYGALEVPERGNVWDALAQDLHTPYGKILRLDVDHGWPGYAVPERNPFVDDVSGLDEIWAWGFRNPYRMSFDVNGDLYVAAVSESLSEAVYRLDGPGNYGWPIREGTRCYDRQNPLDPPESCALVGDEGWPIREPVIEYFNRNVLESDIDARPSGTAVVGGYVYRGEALPDLVGRFVFADYSLDPQQASGVVYASAPEGDVAATWPIEELVRVDGRAQGMGRDDDGELYLLTREAFAPSGDTGRLFRLTLAQDAATEDTATNGPSSDESAQQNEPVEEPMEEPADESADDSAGAGPVSLSYTEQQVASGSDLYDAHCQSCHANDLRSAGPFPPLTGDPFFGTWEGREVAELLAYVRESMPLGAPGSLEDAEYAAIIAYWLDRHGYDAGQAPLPGDPAEVADAPVEDRR